MPVTVNHALTATTPDNTSYEIRPSNWNDAHAVTLAISGTDIIGAFSNANGVSFGTNSSGAITASVSAVAGGVNFEIGGNTSGTTALVSTGTLVLAGGSNITLSQSGNNITVSASVQTQASGGIAGTGFTGTNITGTLDTNGLAVSVPSVSSLSATGLVSISTSASGISIGVNGTTASVWAPWAGGRVTTGAIGNGVMQVYPLFCGDWFSASRADIYGSFSMSTSSNSSYAFTLSAAVGIYTRNGSTLSLASSGSQSYAISNTSNSSTQQVQGVRNISVPFAANVAPGDYWVGIMTQTASSGANWITANNVILQNGISNAAFSGILGATTATSAQSILGFGQFSATTTALPASVGFNQLNGTGANQDAQPAVAFYNVTA